MRKHSKIVVLGAGLIGKTIAFDLSDDFDVLSVDSNPQALSDLNQRYGINTTQGDINDHAFLLNQVQDARLVISALPGQIGYSVLKVLAGTGIDIVDISSFSENPFTLDKVAKESGSTVVVDCGLAPGLGNILIGYHNRVMKVTHYECLVGGLPLERNWPYEYKALFSPADVLEEYIRPARYVDNGRTITVEALSDSELIHCEQVGTLEAFYTDGLKTLFQTMPNVPFMKVKSMRFPGHAELMRILKHTGFFNKDPLSVNGYQIAPIDVTKELLFPAWQLKKNEADFTIMRIMVTGIDKGREVTYTYKLFDRYDAELGFSSMARTTGYTCTATARLILEGKFTRKGISPPEYVGDEPGCGEFIRKYLKQRAVNFLITKTGQTVEEEMVLK